MPKPFIPTRKPYLSAAGLRLELTTIMRDLKHLGEKCRASDPQWEEAAKVCVWAEDVLRNERGRVGTA